MSSVENNKLSFAMKYSTETHKHRILTSGSEDGQYGRAMYVHQRDTPKEHLDILANDNSSHVRTAVASKGHKEHLDKMVHDESGSVREEVARQGHPEHLDKLMHDPDEYVRGAVARNGQAHHIEHLKTDRFDNVRHHAIRRAETLKFEAGVAGKVNDRFTKRFGA